jgi:hypothetical protein
MHNAAHPTAMNPATPVALGLGLLMPLLAVPPLFGMSIAGSDGTAFPNFLIDLFVGLWWLFLAAWPISIALAVTVLAWRAATRPMRVQAWIGLALAASWVPVACWLAAGYSALAG